MNHCWSSITTTTQSKRRRLSWSKFGFVVSPCPLDLLIGPADVLLTDQRTQEAPTPPTLLRTVNSDHKSMRATWRRPFPPHEMNSVCVGGEGEVGPPPSPSPPLSL